MRSPVILIVASVLLLAGAFFASRTLVNDVPAPMVVTPAALIPVEAAPPAMALMPSPARQAVNREEAEAAMLAPRQGLLQQVNAAPVMPRMEPNAPLPPADIAASPFTGESKELDYAEGMMAEMNPGLERLQSAHQAFIRCVEQEPENERCKVGLAASQQRLGGRAASERTPALPTLQVIAPHTRPPSPLR